MANGRGKNGVAYLVGAGPGDPELITLLGARRLSQADCVLYDSLAGPALLELAPPGAERIHTGKRLGDPGIGQEGINRLLCEKVAAGLRVVRLKGGDPLVFGRGGEEAEALSAAGLRFEIVPGVTTAAAAAAYAGLPLTRRGLASSVTFATGNEAPGKGRAGVDWNALAASGGTLCVYMGSGRLAEIASLLMAGGRAGSEPAAVVSRATCPDQNVRETTLAEIAAGIGDVPAPSLLVVGGIVAGRAGCEWREKRPLHGKLILLTRARGQMGRLASVFSELGAAVLEAPAFEIVETDFSDPSGGNGDPLSSVLLALRRTPPTSADWLVFTSVNGVEGTWRRMRRLGLDARLFSRGGVAAIGNATAGALREIGIHPDLVPVRSDAQSLFSAFREKLGGMLAGRRFFLFASDISDETLPGLLEAEGAVCEKRTAYRNIPAARPDPAAAAALAEGRVAAVPFASGSAARNFARLFEKELSALAASGALPRFVAIGDATAREMRAAGLPVDARAERPGIEELAGAVVGCLSPSPAQRDIP